MRFLGLILFFFLAGGATAFAETRSPYGLPRADEIMGVEVLIASASDDAVYSRFGHVMLRFVRDDGNFSEDPVLSFVANVGFGAVDTLKGLDGGYKVLADLHPYSDFWNEYINREHRTVERYLVPTTDADRFRLLQTLEEWREHPAKAGNYTFQSNNCATVLAKFLSDAGFSTSELFLPKIPVLLGTWLRRNFLSPFPTLVVKASDSLGDLVAVPENLYERCDSSDCAKIAAESVRKTWSAVEQKDAFREDDFAYWLSLKNTCGDSCTYREVPSRLPKAIRERASAFQLYLQSAY